LLEKRLVKKDLSTKEGFALARYYKILPGELRSAFWGSLIEGEGGNKPNVMVQQRAHKWIAPLMLASWGVSTDSYGNDM
jgi:hypothetical protein